ncbi:hypothetical protein [Sphingomonas melonis]|uniref:hypothetical protein n=1 Tax=Sphingomonas melonis TaxID=152682 RepID=UPI0012DEA9DB|nr:hypothetical protein [Sphingomonas melonis]
MTAETLDDLKNAVLLHILEHQMGDPSGPTAYSIKTQVARAGYSEQLASLGMLALSRDGFLDAEVNQDRDGDPYHTYVLTDLGRDTLLAQYASLKRAESNRPVNSATNKGGFADDLDDEVPF